MGVVLWQILQWMLRIILWLIFLLLGVMLLVLFVPIRYRVQGNYRENAANIKGNITWFFHLINIEFEYQKEFRMRVRVCKLPIYVKGHKIKRNEKKDEIQNLKIPEKADTTYEGAITGKEKSGTTEDSDRQIKEQKVREDRTKAGNGAMEEASEKNKKRVTLSDQNAFREEEEKEPGFHSTKTGFSFRGKKKEKKTLSDILSLIAGNCMAFIKKIKEILERIREGKEKAEYYLSLWNAPETQITLQRAKKKTGKMIKSMMPRKWELTGHVGCEDPAVTGCVMGVLGSLYPFTGNKVRMVPEFDQKVITLEGDIRGHICLGKILYQLVSFVLNKHCMKVIKMIFEEFGNSGKKEI